MVLDEVMRTCGIAVWETVVGNVVLAGGMWRIKGMQMYFKKRVSEFISKFPKQEALGIRKKISIIFVILGFVNWGFNPSEVSWIGASVGASVKAVDSMCLKKS